MKNRRRSAITEQTALAFFARHLDGLKWNYHYSKDKRYLFSGFTGDSVLWDFSTFAHQKGEGDFLLGVNSFIPAKVPADRLAACAELLTRLNNDLSVGCFELDYPRREIRFRTSVTLPGGDITPGIVADLVRSNLAITDGKFPAIAAVLYSAITPEAALKPSTCNPQPPNGSQQQPGPEPRFELN